MTTRIGISVAALVGRDQGERDGAGRRGGARDEDDRAPVAPIGHVTAEQHQGERRDRLDEPEPAERERVAGDDVDLVSDDGRERAGRERRREARPEERPEVVLSEEGRQRCHPSSMANRQRVDRVMSAGTASVDLPMNWGVITS